MSRRFSSTRAILAANAEQRRLDRALASSLRAREVAMKQAQRQAASDYTAHREGQALQKTGQVEAIEKQLDAILSHGAQLPINFDSLKVKPQLPVFSAQGLDVAGKAPELISPAPLSFWQKWFPFLVNQFENQLAEATDEYDSACKKYAERESARIAMLEKIKETYRAGCNAADADAARANADVDSFRVAYMAHDHDAVAEYFTSVFDADALPEGLPHSVRVAFDPDSRQLVIERQLPTLDAIPEDISFKYVKKTDKIEGVARKPADRRSLYTRVLAQIALRSLRVALTTDGAGSFDVIAFNGFVDTIDPKDGQRVTPTLISVSTTRADIEKIGFDRVDPTACLVGLRALVSRSAHELQAVRPIVSFDMVDRRFIDKTDVLSQLDSRPNLAELSPSEFEGLMTNLFEKMGLETRLTQASRDGGVDCVAWDMRPVIGGKVVIQAKRYKNTVGVSAIRDLYGTMMNEGAAKGILVTTSGYGPTTYDFAKGKPLELITGSNLLALLSEHAGIEAKIEFPNEWVDLKPSDEPQF